jgi:hypothetical protein
MDILKYNLDLKKCETLGQVLDVVKKYYDVDNCTIGAITKGTIIVGLNKAVQITNCKPK